jgi:hypothetical protein
MNDDQTAVRTTTRRRRSWAMAVIAVAVAVTATAAAFAAATTPAGAASTAASAAASSPRNHVTVLRFGVKFSDFHIVDVPPLGKTPQDAGIGDYVVFSDDLLDTRGRVVGTEGGSGLLTKVTATEAQVFYDLAIGLPHGQIAAQGLASPAPVKRLAVVGGTGRYVGAAGHMELTENGDGTGRLVITLGA